MQHLARSSILRRQESGEYARYIDRARRELAGRDLRDGLSYTLHVVDLHPILYDALAVRWVLTAAEEKGFSLHDAQWALERLDEYRLPARRDVGERIANLLQNDEKPTAPPP